MMSIDAIETLFDEERFDEAWRQAAETLDGERGQRLARSERQRLAKVAGMSALRHGRLDEAALRLGVAWTCDPLDAAVCATYGHLLFELGRGAEGAPVFESLLVHHRDELTERTLGVVLRSIAQVALERGETTRALELVTEAIDANDADMAAATLRIDILERLERGDDAASERDALIRRVDNATVRASLRTAQARHLDAAGDATGAAEQRFLAWRDDPTRGATDALAHELGTVGRHDDRAVVMLARADAVTGAERARRMVELADVLAGPAQRPRDAATALEKALDADPTELAPFERLTALLHQLGDWPALHDAYARTIRRVLEHRPDDRALLATLWRNLGEICRLHLDDAEGARTAYATSLRYRRDHSTEDLVLDLSARVDAPDAQIASLREALDAEPERADRLERLGALWMQSGARDRGYTVLRWLPLLGGSSERASALVEALDRRRPAAPPGAVDAETRRRLVRPSPERHPLDAAFAVATHLLDEHLRRDTDDYGLGERDRLDLNEPLLVTRAVNDAARALSATPPPTYLSDAATSVGVVWLGQPALVVPRAMLGGVPERELRYAIAERVVVLSAETALSYVMPPEGLKLVLAAAIHLVRPDFEIGDAPVMKRLVQGMKRAMKPHWREPLQIAVERLFADEAMSDVDAWRSRVHLEAVRMAYLMCDCPRATMAVIERQEPEAAPWIRRALVHWTLTDGYATARQQLGLAVG